MAKSRTQSRCLPWFGAGTNVAEYHASLLAECKHVTVLFGGGLSIERFLVETASEIVVNDKHLLAMNFYSVISTQFGRQELIDRLKLTPFHSEVLLRSQEMCKEWQTGSVRASGIDLACDYFITAWMGRSGKSGTDSEFDGGLAMRWDAGGGSSPLRFQTAVRSIQEVWGPICERCSFVCKDWREILSKVKDDPKLGLFVDPPWVDAGDGYVHKFTAEDHVQLHDELNSFKRTKVVVRYGDHADVRSLYRDWRITEFGTRNQANNEVAELCITNFDHSGSK